MKHPGLLKAYLNNDQVQPRENLLPICPRLIDLYADFIYKGGYKVHDVQNSSLEFKRMLYKSFLSQLTPDERQLSIYDQIEMMEFI